MKLKFMLHKIGICRWQYVTDTYRRCTICKREEKLFVMGSVGVGIEESWRDREWWGSLWSDL